jgi:hypothetical protein
MGKTIKIILRLQNIHALVENQPLGYKFFTTYAGLRILILLGWNQRFRLTKKQYCAEIQRSIVFILYISYKAFV